MSDGGDGVSGAEACGDALPNLPLDIRARNRAVSVSGEERASVDGAVTDVILMG